jgi:hypothetical protein
LLEEGRENGFNELILHFWGQSLVKAVFINDHIEVVQKTFFHVADDFKVKIGVYVIGRV